MTDSSEHDDHVVKPRRSVSTARTEFLLKNGQPYRPDPENLPLIPNRLNHRYGPVIVDGMRVIEIFHVSQYYRKVILG